MQSAPYITAAQMGCIRPKLTTKVRPVGGQHQHPLPSARTPAPRRSRLVVIAGVHGRLRSPLSVLAR